jgi:microsomal epoxide hydrolase
MGFLRLSLLLSLAVLGLGLAIQWYWDLENTSNLEKVEKWADDNKIILNAKNTAEKFEVKFEQNEWDFLVQKLNNTRYFESIEAADFDYGFPVEYAKELVNYWKKDFNWKKQVDNINRYQNYKINLDGIILHFVRVTSVNKNIKSIPILLLNGWPSAFYEFYEALDYITKNDQRSFDIIVPSMPGFAYSTPLTKIFDLFDIARTYDGLMRHLFGENSRYFIHGEDWGSVIASTLAIMYPKRVSGIHISMVPPTSSITKRTILTTLITDMFPSCMLTVEEKASNFQFSLSKRFVKLIKGTGYFHQQATKPDTIGFGFTDSPVGLMTYILEKYSIGSFSYSVVGTKDGNLNKLSRDDLLSVVTIYWMTNSMTSSMRLYKNSMSQLGDEWPKNSISKYSTPVSVPVAVISFPNEVDHTPYAVLRKIFGNLKQYSIMKSGGHFAAFVEPKATMDDFIKFIDSVAF